MPCSKTWRLTNRSSCTHMCKSEMYQQATLTAAGRAGGLALKPLLLAFAVL